MTINKLLYYAVNYYELGFNITTVSPEYSKFNFLENPKRLKAPFNDELYLQSNRQEKNELLSYEWDKIVGIGVVLGVDNTCAIDIDGCEDFEIVKLILNYLQLPNDYPWVIKSGSQIGFHIIIKTTLPPTNYQRLIEKSLENDYRALYTFDKTFGLVDCNAYYPRKWYNNRNKLLIDDNSFCKIEFKWKGHIILPPSLHNSGRYYEFIFGHPKNSPNWIDFQTLSNLQCLISGDGAITSCSPGYVGIKAITDKEENEKKGSSIIIDCETNGLPLDFSKSITDTINWPRLLQISWITCNNGLCLQKRETRNIIPEHIVFNTESELIHGLSLEFLNKNGETLRNVLNDFLKDIAECTVIVGHNLEFDMNVIKCELFRLGIETNILDKKKLFCTMLNSKDICRIGPEPFKYPSLFETYSFLFKKDITINHNSIYDATITMKVYNELLKLADTSVDR